MTNWLQGLPSCLRRNPFTGSGHSFLFDLKENSVFFKRSRNPFTGSGHSFDGGWNVFEVKWEVVIPLPVQVILSQERKKCLKE